MGHSPTGGPVSGAPVQNVYALQIASMLRPVKPFLDSPKISEVMINGPNEVWVEMSGKLRKTDVKFEGDEELMAAIRAIAQYVGKQFDKEHPRLDARLPDGSRVAATMPPVTRGGICVAIRKFFSEKLTMEQLKSFGSISADAVEFLRICVEMKKNMLISGGTGSGKTSLLNVITGQIPKEERVLILEDVKELQPQGDHIVQMECAPGDKEERGKVEMKDLLHSTLRMRPDRIIVGEIRGGEALDLLNAMNSGHGGSLATIHASSPTQALQKLETLTLYSGFDLPLFAVRSMVSAAIEIVVQGSRFKDGSRKITNISEVLPLTADGRFATQDIYRYEFDGMSDDGKVLGEVRWVGNKPTWADEITAHGVVWDPAMFADSKKPKIVAGAPPKSLGGGH